MKTVAVIGASGFVGATLVERLLGQRKDDVIAFIHSSGNAWRLSRLGIDLKPLDLLDPHCVEASLAGVTHVVNCSRGDDEVMLRGLRNVLRASSTRRIHRFIHLSSVAVYGDPPPPESVHEDARTAPAEGTYGWIKLQQDRMVARACREGLASIILCPPNISGPYSDFLIGLIDALRSSTFAFVDGGEAPCNLVDVTNLTAAIELALTEGPADGARLFVTDDENTSWRAVVDALAPLAGLEGAIPVIEREQLLRMASETGVSRISLLKSLKHLISSDVRQALRKDPLWNRIDTALRHGVTRMGKSIEQSLRLSIEGPTNVAEVSAGTTINARLCRQQLRGVAHSCELAKSRLGYRPFYTVAESMEAFRAWYRYYHGMDSNAWQLLRQLM
jgi:nucleoside-diphosphate-sugar epimerase